MPWRSVVGEGRCNGDEDLHREGSCTVYQPCEEQTLWFDMQEGLEVEEGK